MDAFMLPSMLSNCQEDVDQLMNALGNLDEVAQPLRPSEQDLHQEAHEVFSVSAQAASLQESCPSRM